MIKEVKITIYFFLGRYDYQVASIVAEKINKLMVDKVFGNIFYIIGKAGSKFITITYKK